MKGMLFKEDLFRAVIAGLKTQTRRIIPEKEIVASEMDKPEIREFLAKGRAPYKKGDVVYLKEPWCKVLIDDSPDGITVEYKYHPSTVLEDDDYHWYNKLFMPAKDARHFIKITDVKVERLQDITHGDAISEGFQYNADLATVNCYCSEDLPHIGDGLICDDGLFNNPKDAFFSLWQTINGRSSYVANPWVFVYTFELTSNPEHLSL